MTFLCAVAGSKCGALILAVTILYGEDGVPVVASCVVAEQSLASMEKDGIGARLPPFRDIG